MLRNFIVHEIKKINSPQCHSTQRQAREHGRPLKSRSRITVIPAVAKVKKDWLVDRLQIPNYSSNLDTNHNSNVFYLFSRSNHTTKNEWAIQYVRRAIVCAYVRHFRPLKRPGVSSLVSSLSFENLLPILAVMMQEMQRRCSWWCNKPSNDLWHSPFSISKIVSKSLDLKNVCQEI